MSTRLVSIIIRTKNEEKWISSCLKSVFKQEYKNIEVIVVDNESTDRTVI
jgi:rhamnosyltransferase